MNVPRLLISLLALLLVSACSAAPVDTNLPAPDGPVEPDNPTEQPAAEAPRPDPTRNPLSPGDYSELEIITLLPQDAIPAIDDPEFLTSAEADDEYAPDELVIGVEFNGDARAYSISHLSRFEIVNDTVGGVALSVTW